MTNSSNISASVTKVIKYPIITDKATRLLEKNQYSFVVDRYASKPMIKQEIESLFEVTVTDLNTCRLPRKKKRVGKFVGWKPQYKKAIITLKAGNSINLFTES